MWFLSNPRSSPARHINGKNHSEKQRLLYISASLGNNGAGLLGGRLAWLASMSYTRAAMSRRIKENVLHSHTQLFRNVGYFHFSRLTLDYPTDWILQYRPLDYSEV